MPRVSSVRITDTTIKTAKPRARRYEIRDSALPGFMLRIAPSGKKLFYVQLERGKKRKIGDSAIMTLTRARRLALNMLQRHEAGEKIKSRLDKDPTLDDFITQIYGPWASENFKTGMQNINRLNSACGSLLNTRLDKLTEIQIERWKIERLKSGLSPSTVKRDLAELKAALTRAAEWGDAPSNPASGIKVMVETHYRVRYLDKNERKRLLDALKARDKKKREARDSGNMFRLERGYETKPDLGEYADYLTPLVTLVLNTGLRRSEALSLSWEQVNLGTNPHLTVLAAYAKSRKTRHVPLNAAAVKDLKRWGGQGSKKGFVFPGAGGGKLKSIKTAWGKLMKDAKIEDFRFHDLRHDFASRLVMAGVDLYRVKELLGHSSIEITQRYAHLAPHTLAEAVEVLA
ncbi:tyrosine-type recombinase/integrase [Pseudomonadota bacterium]